VRCSVDNRCDWIEPDHPILSVRQQSEILGLNRSIIYYKPRPKVFSEEKLKLLRLVDEIYTKHPFMGSRQMSDYISRHHAPCKRHEIRWAYENLGLQSVAPGPHTSKPHPEHKIYPYLLKDLKIVRPCQVFSTDITYVRMHKGFVYLTAIIDWYSRFVLDWQLSISMEADFCIETLGRVLASTHCEIFNTDQGAQFTSKGFIDLLLENNVQISMDGKGRWVDNVFVERLWRSVKYECIYLYEWTTVVAIRKALCEYFHFYNYERPHQGLGGLTPHEVHSGKILT
jgi:putative transposase